MIYQILIRLLSPIIWLLILADSVTKKGGRTFFLQRLGLEYPELPLVSKRIWLHCASVGEVKAAEPLIKALEPQYHILITTNTITGQQLVKELFRDKIDHCYLPLDWPFAIRHFLTCCQPTDGWILETEIWPNLYRLCAQENIDLKIINARLSQKTLNAPDWLKKNYQQSLQCISQILARSPAEAERFIALGASAKKVQILGNLKYAQATAISHNAASISRDYVLLASSHKEEEVKIAQLWKKLKRPELLVIVPRHPKRSSAIQKQLKGIFSQLAVASKQQEITANTDVYLDDRLGRLMPLFEHAKLVIMGGSFVAKGGHNILEPAAYQKAIITGFDMSDFKEETTLLLKHHGLIQCQNYAELNQHLSSLLSNPIQCQIMGENAKKALEFQSEILQNYLDQLLKPA